MEQNNELNESHKETGADEKPHENDPSNADTSNPREDENKEVSEEEIKREDGNQNANKIEHENENNNEKENSNENDKDNKRKDSHDGEENIKKDSKDDIITKSVDNENEERYDQSHSRKRTSSRSRSNTRDRDYDNRRDSRSYESSSKRQHVEGDRYDKSYSSRSTSKGRDSDTGRSSRSRDTDSSSSSSQPMRIKFLMTGNEAGGVIGRGGATIAIIQSETGARVKISAAREMYPGTQSRVGMLEGTRQALELGFRKVVDLMYVSDELKRISQERNPMTVQFIVPSSIAPAVVGNNDNRIRQLSENTKTQISITRKEDELPGYRERLMTVTGRLQDIPLVADEFIAAMAADPVNGKYSNPTTMYQSPFGRDRGGYDQSKSSYGYGAGDNSYQQPATTVLPPPGVDASQAMQLDLAVPDEQVGVIVGKGGETLLQLQSQSGTRIKISNRGDYLPGTKHRKVTIVGTQQACKVAKDLIMSKLGDTGSGGRGNNDTQSGGNMPAQNDYYNQGYYQQQQQPPPYGQYYGDYSSNYPPPYNTNPPTQSGYDYYSAPASTSMPYNSSYSGNYYSNSPPQTDYSHYYASLPPPTSFSSAAPPPSSSYPSTAPSQQSQQQYYNQNYQSGSSHSNSSSNYYNR